MGPAVIQAADIVAVKIERLIAIGIAVVAGGFICASKPRGTYSKIFVISAPRCVVALNLGYRIRIFSSVGISEIK